MFVFFFKCGAWCRGTGVPLTMKGQKILSAQALGFMYHQICFCSIWYSKINAHLHVSDIQCRDRYQIYMIFIHMLHMISWIPRIFCWDPWDTHNPHLAW